MTLARPAGATARLNGAEIYYEIDEGRTEPLLLLHGGTGCNADWDHAGREQLAGEYRLIRPDARGHGSSTDPEGKLSHRQIAADTIALLDHLGIARCRAVGVSMGGNALLHIATTQPERIEAMVLVSATMHFPPQARAIMGKVPVDDAPPEAWEVMRRRHKRGDDQIRALWRFAHWLKDSTDDVNFTAPDLAKITARTLVICGDRDFLYPVEMGVALYRAIPMSALWVVPNGGHGPVFGEAAPRFAETALAFLRA